MESTQGDATADAALPVDAFGHSRSPMVIEADQMFPPIGEPNSLQSWIADQRSGRWQLSRREAPERTRHEDAELHPGWHRDRVDELWRCQRADREGRPVHWPRRASRWTAASNFT